MTSGIRRALPALAALLAAGSCCTPPAAAADWGVEQLMRSLAQVQSSTARFVERKHLAILNAPLESSGTLLYTAP
ncbi:MAG: outer membrane lipoprotein carrier protein LolA, partial [Burkholderiales bacterium]